MASSQLPSFHPQRSDFSRPDPLPSVSSLNPLSTLHLHIFIKPFKVGENKYLPSTHPLENQTQNQHLQCPRRPWNVRKGPGSQEPALPIPVGTVVWEAPSCSSRLMLQLTTFLTGHPAACGQVSIPSPMQLLPLLLGLLPRHWLLCRCFLNFERQRI